MKKLSLYLMALLYAAAGLNHFIRPQTYIKIMPSWVPWHQTMVLVSGIFELLFAILLLFPATRRLAAFGIIILLIAIFPANIQMMIDYRNEGNPLLWVAIVRLPLQVVLIWWAYFFVRNKSQTK